MAGTAMAERLTIVAPVANIRSGPDTKSDILWKVEKYYPIFVKPGTKEKILFTVEKGIPFKVLKSKGHWLNVEHADGDRGWIHDSLVW